MSTTATPERDLQMIAPTKIVQREGHNPRGDVDHEGDAFHELKASIEQHGVLQPILVGPANIESGKEKLHPVIAGHRRHAAALELGLEQIPTMVVELNGSELSAAIAENLIREDMTPLQEARAIRRLREAGMKQIDVAKALGKSERWVRDREKLLDVPESVQERVDAGELPLEAIAHLVPLAQVRPEIATAVVDHVAGGKARGGADLSSMAKKAIVWSALEQVAPKVGLQEIPDFGSASPTQLAVDADDRKELKQLHGDLPQAGYQSRPGFKFTDADAKEAKREGALLEAEVERWAGEKHKVRYITDPKLTAQLAKRKIPAMRKEAERLVKEQNERGLGGPAAGGDSGQPAADRQKQIEREERKREKERKQLEAANKKLGERLSALSNPKATDVDLIRLVCAMALGEEDFAGELVEGGLGQLAPDTYGWDEDKQLFPDRTIFEELRAAKTAGECLKVFLRAVVAAQHVLTPNGGPSYFIPGPQSGDPLDIRLMVDDAAEKLDLLPPAQMAKVKERRKEAQEHAKRLEAQRKAEEAEAKKRAEEKAEGEELSSRAERALELISQTPGITASDIAREMEIKPNYLYRILGDLEGKGLIAKKGRKYTVVGKD